MNADFNAYRACGRRFVRPVDGKTIPDMSRDRRRIDTPRWVPATSYYTRAIQRGDLKEDPEAGVRDMNGEPVNLPPAGEGGAAGDPPANPEGASEGGEGATPAPVTVSGAPVLLPRRKR